MKYLLDTNVLRQIGNPNCHPNVGKWLQGVDDLDLFTSALVLRESFKGAELIRSKKPQAAADIEARLVEIIGHMADRILPIDHVVARVWGRMLAESGRHVDDTALAATAEVHGMTVVTRNVDHFRRRGVPLLDPYKDPPALL